eukprot:SM000019S04932  [mRNA]  locus=s19:64261:71420:- [translate_table: standard]
MTSRSDGTAAGGVERHGLWLATTLAGASPEAVAKDLQRAYVEGHGGAGARFNALRDHLSFLLPTALPLAPATFALRCLRAVQALEPPFAEGLSYLVLSALSRVDKSHRREADSAEARAMAAALLHAFATGDMQLNARLMVRLVTTFGVTIADVPAQQRGGMEDLVARLTVGREYTSAVDLMRQLGIPEPASTKILAKMVEEGRAEVAAAWAEQLGAAAQMSLVEQCMAAAQFKVAHTLVERFHLQQQFPDSFSLYRRSSVKKLVGKGLWDVAESLVRGNADLAHYLATLALDAGNKDLVSELCVQYNLDELLPEDVAAKIATESHQYLHISSLIPEAHVIWVESARDLQAAKNQLLLASNVGIDCEWKANHTKGEGQNKVATLQLATSEYAYVFDVIRLAAEVPDLLGDCLYSLFQDSTILKLGYGVRNDLARLAASYPMLTCFHLCTPVLDLHTLAGRGQKGGLSQLATRTLGLPLDKRVRMSDWEQRPLSEQQIRYAAMDAVCLLPIFVRLQSSDFWEEASSTVPPDWQGLTFTFKHTGKTVLEEGRVSGVHGQDFARPLSLGSVEEALQDMGWHPSTAAQLLNKDSFMVQEQATKWQGPEGSLQEEATLGPSLRKHYALLDKQGLAESCIPLIEAKCVGVLVQEPPDDPPASGKMKGRLQTWAQRLGLPIPDYTTTTYGPPHLPVFQCHVRIGSASFQGKSAQKKKDAEFSAALGALQALQGQSALAMALAAEEQERVEVKHERQQPKLLVVIVPKTMRPDLAKLAALLGEPRRNFHPATAQESIYYFGCNKGLLPPVGYGHDVTTMVHVELLISAVSNSAAISVASGSLQEKLVLPPSFFAQFKAADLAKPELEKQDRTADTSEGSLRGSGIEDTQTADDWSEGVDVLRQAVQDEDERFSVTCSDAESIVTVYSPLCCCIRAQASQCQPRVAKHTLKNGLALLRRAFRHARGECRDGRKHLVACIAGCSRMCMAVHSSATLLGVRSMGTWVGPYLQSRQELIRSTVRLLYQALTAIVQVVARMSSPVLHNAPSYNQSRTTEARHITVTAKANPLQPGRRKWELMSHSMSHPAYHHLGHAPCWMDLSVTSNSRPSLFQKPECLSVTRRRHFAMLNRMLRAGTRRRWVRVGDKRQLLPRYDCPVLCFVYAAVVVVVQQACSHWSRAPCTSCSGCHLELLDPIVAAARVHEHTWLPATTASLDGPGSSLEACFWSGPAQPPVHGKLQSRVGARARQKTFRLHFSKCVHLVVVQLGLVCLLS